MVEVDSVAHANLNLLIHKQFFHYFSVFLMKSSVMKTDAEFQRRPQVAVTDILQQRVQLYRNGEFS